MNALPRAVLEGWSERWRYPDLVMRLADSDADLSASEVARLTVRGIANPVTPELCIAALVSEGEFAVAERLLATLAFPRTTVSALQATIQSAREHSANEVAAELLALRSRAASVGLTGLPDSLSDLVHARRAEADAALDEWRIEVAVREDEWELRLRGLAKELLAREGAGLASQRLGERVEGCLRARQFAAAEHLLRHLRVPAASDVAVSSAWPARHDGKLSATPYDFPPRDEWPWRLPLRDVLAWYEEGAQAPPDFHAWWRPSDNAAAELIEALRRATEKQAPPDVLANELRQRLDALVGGPDSGATGLATLSDPFLAPVRLIAGRALPLALDFGGSAEAEHKSEAPSIVVSLDGAANRDSELVLSATELLRLLGGVNDRRVQLLRAICGQLPLVDSIDPGAVTQLPAMSMDELRVYVAWLLDLLNIRHDTVVPDVLVGLAAGHLEPALVLLAGLASRVADRERVATALLLHEVASGNSAFQEAAWSAIFGRLEGDPLARRIVATLGWYDPSGTDPQPVHGVAEVLELSGVPDADEASVAVALWKLKDLEIAEETPDGFCIYPDVSRLVHMLVPDLDAFLAQDGDLKHQVR